MSPWVDGDALTPANLNNKSTSLGINVKDAAYGATGDGVTDDSAAFRAAFAAIEAAGGGVLIVPNPSVSYRFGSTVTVPNVSFVVRGANGTKTLIAPLASATSIVLFTITNAAGPSKVFRDIKFEGPATGVAGTGAAVQITNSNGVHFDDCWWAGCNIGVDYVSGSFVSGTNNTFEYCNNGIYAAASMIESQWHNTTYYHNVLDIRLTGDNATFAHIGSNHIGTLTVCIQLVDCDHAQFSDASFCDDGSGRTPVLVQLTQSTTGCKRNKIAGITAKSFGLCAVSLEGSGTQFNDISGVVANAVPTGILASSASRNTIRGLQLKGCTSYGIDVQGPSNTISDFVIDGCATGIRVASATNNSFSEGAIINSTSADWSVSGATTLWVRGVEADFSAITLGAHVALLGSRVGNGRVEGFAAAAPGTIGYTFAVGDKIWKTDAAANGSPGWVCTTGGDPATWKAMPAVAA